MESERYKRFLAHLKLVADKAAVSIAAVLSRILFNRYAGVCAAGCSTDVGNGKPRRLLSVEIGGLGDLARITPYRDALKTFYPDSHLTVVTHERNRPFFQWATAPDDVLFFSPAHRSPAGKILFFIKLQHLGSMDLVADFTGSYFSAWITQLSGAARSAGSPREGFRSFYSHPVPRYLDRPLTHHYRDVLEALGVRNDALPQRGRRKRVKRQSSSSRHGSQVVLHPGSGWKGRRWPWERWAAVARELSNRKRVRIVLTGSEAERELTDLIAGETGEGVTNLAGRLSFTELAELVEDSDLFLSANVGPMHLARALACPTVTLYGPYSPLETGYPDDDGHTGIFLGLSCSPCGTFTHTPTCGDFRCLTGISVDHVVKTACDVLIRQER